MLTDDKIRDLIEMPKIIDSPPRVITTNNANFVKKVFTLSSLDKEHKFNCFFTQNLDFSENFSLGLAYNPKEEKGVIVLIRCNGLHGGTKQIIPHHRAFHIHLASEERIRLGLRPVYIPHQSDPLARFNLTPHFGGY